MILIVAQKHHRVNTINTLEKRLEMPTYSRKNLVLGKQGPFAATFPKTTNAQTLLWDAGNGSFVNPSAVNNDIVDASNLGGGVNVFDNQVGDELFFNTLQSGGNTTITKSGNEIVISSGIYVVDNIPARDALIPTLSSGPAGVQVFVKDDGQGEYVLFLWDGTGFITLSTQDSSSTDSQTVQKEMTYTQGSISLVTVSPTSRISNLVVEVLDTFDNPNAFITIGDDTNGNDIHLASDLVDLDIMDKFETSSTFIYPSPNEETVKAYLSPGASTKGLLRITLTYV